MTAEDKSPPPAPPTDPVSDAPAAATPPVKTATAQPTPAVEALAHNNPPDTPAPTDGKGDQIRFPFDATKIVQARHRDFHDHLDAAVKVASLFAVVAAAIFAWFQINETKKLDRYRYTMDFVSTFEAGQMSTVMAAASAPIDDLLDEFNDVSDAGEPIDPQSWANGMKGVDEGPFRRLVVYFEKAHSCGDIDICDSDKIQKMLREDATYLVFGYGHVVCARRKFDPDYASGLVAIAGIDVDSEICTLYE